MPNLSLRFPFLVPLLIIRQKHRFHDALTPRRRGAISGLNFYSFFCPRPSSQFASSGIRCPFDSSSLLRRPISSPSSSVVRLGFHFCLYPLLPWGLFCESPSTLVTPLYSSRVFDLCLSSLFLTNKGPSPPSPMEMSSGQEWS
ncbi:hypothetical protein GALMADRAFT_1141399 [Galerina marginata CBS 339.88]|uniref:Uncharacterized protein n=1 Tax=Galerina marginata (strain CBS 339.88) TaxID=685588 RepID=A0A067SA67_GALM3|nr:hypothetical protein GALMADRAFT_1141399 [Galerina marginata CBS 339.88]